MAVETFFVVSVLGQDLFWDGNGDLTQDSSIAAVYTRFASAEAAMADAASIHARAFGPAGFEIRTVIISQ